MDNRLHNDCDGGFCCACQWDAEQEKKRNTPGWGTDTDDFARAVAEFEENLPGFWWSVGQCSVGAHASCAVDGNGVQGDLLEHIAVGHPYDVGFHCDTKGGSPAEALRYVMNAALNFIENEETNNDVR